MNNKPGTILNAQGKPIKVKASYTATQINPFYRGFDVSPSIVPSNYERDSLAGLCRDLYKNNLVFAGIVNKLTSLIVGSGLFPVSVSNSKKFNSQFEEVWKRWIRTPEISGNYSWDSLCRVIVLNIILEGEAFIILTKSTNGFPRVQILPSSILGKGDYDGIRKDKHGEVIGYDVYLDTVSKEDKFKFYDKDVQSLIFIPLDSAQYRGTPLFASAINTLKDIIEIWDYEKQLIKAQTRIAGFVKNQSGEQEDNGGFEAFGGAETLDDIAKATESQLANIDPAKLKYYKDLSRVGPELWTLQQNDDLKLIEGTTPHTNTQAFINSLVNLCADVSGVPSSVLMSDDNGGAQTRRDLAIAQRRVYEIQQILTTHLSKVFKYVIGIEVENGNLPEVEDKENHTWNYPAEIVADLGRVAEADLEQVRQGLMSLTEYCAKYGFAVHDLIRERIKDIKLIKEYCEKEGLNPQDVLPILFSNMKL